MRFHQIASVRFSDFFPVSGRLTRAASVPREAWSKAMPNQKEGAARECGQATEITEER